MKDKIVYLNNDEPLYVVEEMTHHGRRYIFAYQYEEKSYSIKEDPLYILQVSIVDGNVAITPVTGDKLLKELLARFKSEYIKKD